MTNDCSIWKNALLEAVLTGAANNALEAHVSQCANCTGELAALRTRREQLDSLLPQLAQGAEPSVDFRARLLAVAEATHSTWRPRFWPSWSLVGVTGLIAAVLVVGWAFHPGASSVPETELLAAEKLTQWRAPSDVLLAAPGAQILQTTPKLGQSYLPVIPRSTANTNEEE